MARERDQRNGCWDRAYAQAIEAFVDPGHDALPLRSSGGSPKSARQAQAHNTRRGRLRVRADLTSIRYAPTNLLFIDVSERPPTMHAGGRSYGR
jgi:hypothetical protein